MANRENRSGHPVDRYQNFLDETLGSDDEAIEDLQSAASLFQKQNDFQNFQKIQAVIQAIQKAEFTPGEKEIEHNQRRDEANKDFGSLEHHLRNAAQYNAFILEVAKEFPNLHKPQQSKLAAVFLFKHLEEQFDNEEKKYTDLDREVIKAIGVHLGLEVKEKNNIKIG